jgi:predicted acetyltransferase
MGTDVRGINDDELPRWGDAMWRGFHHETVDGWAEFARPDLDLSRTIAAFDRDRVVGTLRSFASTLTVPGGAIVPSAALTNVTVAPTHRRQGLLRRMLEPDLAAAKERGEPVGMLIAAEFPIYGRFGYGSAADHAGYEVDARTVQFTRPGTGTVELVDAAELRKQAPTLYERLRHDQPGFIERDDRWWDRSLQIIMTPGDKPHKKAYLAVHRNDAGEPEGYLRYHTDGKWDVRRPDGTLEVDELVAVTPDAYARLWRYCCEVDWVAHVSAGDRRTTEALPWIVEDGRHVVQKWRADFLWVRILDVAAALSARTYLTSARVVLEVVDAQGLATGRFALDGGPDGASCAATGDAAQLTVTAEALGAAYLGGVALRTLAAAGQVDVHDDAALATADAMFRGTIDPWCSTWF